MEKWKQRICGIGILLSVVSATFALEVTIPQSEYIVARGEEVTITCNFQPKKTVNDLIIISWTADRDGSAEDEEISFGTFYSSNNHVDINQMYVGKAQIISDVNTRVSKLKLTQVTVRESRRIRCRVKIPGDDIGQTSATTSLEVQVPPSDPICKIKGTPEYGYNISLTCVSDEGFPVPTYKWQSYDITNVQRSFPPKTTEQNGVLSLFNISKDTSGYYICTSTNSINSASCNLTLSVMPSTMKISAAAGIIGGCIAGVAVLVLIIYCCCRKKEKLEKFEMEPPVIEYHDSAEKEKGEEVPLDLRKASIEGSIDRREKIELKVEKISEYGDQNSNRHFDQDDHHDRSVDHREDDRRDNYNRGHYDDHKGHYKDHQDHYDDRRDRFDDRRDRYDVRRDHYDDRPDHRDRYDDRKDYRDRHDDRYGDHRDTYDDRQGRYDDRRDRYDDRFDDRRDRYDDRQDSYEKRRERYDDRRDR
ncbi:cell surface A33 antigen [Hoplias malabaricus]|uniref:cell surface A33 antigen n=1 Tax=Hoplias malabaricus TaxID=27720 RepID=UPI003461C216